MFSSVQNKFDFSALHRRFLPFMEKIMGRKRLDESVSSNEALKRAQKRYEKTEKRKASKARYRAKPEVKARNSELSLSWYHRQKESDPDFLKRQAEKARLRRIKKAQQQKET